MKSFLNSQNREYVENLHSVYNTDPFKLDSSWQDYFDGIEEPNRQASSKQPSWYRNDWPQEPNGETLAALDGHWPDQDAATLRKKISKISDDKNMAISEDQLKQAVLDSVRALMLIRAYRIRGHLSADLDPLKIAFKTEQSELNPESYGFNKNDYDRRIFLDNVLGLTTATIREIVEILKRTYCGTFALQYMHISDPEQASWLKERIEGLGKEIQFTVEGRRAILNKLIEAEGFEKFLHRKYMGTKRFGLDGAESLIPAMEQIIKRGGNLGVKEIIIGMPHRGRLSVLANVMAKPFRAIFNEFQGGSYKPEE
jgi:2-oxoglutarate dehydrogenase complex, dehydrogenase (E1) component, and related enzymes